MIDETLLADPTRCPDCATPLTPARDVCPGCALRLAGPLAGRLWQVSVQAAEVLRTRAELLAELRARTVAASTVPTVPMASVAAPTLRSAADAVAPVVRRPRAEWTLGRVQNLLLALGVLLLGVAAVIFVAVSWERLGVGGRSAVMAGVTALAAGSAVWTHRRGLLSTAEWLSALTVGLALLDCFGARSADLAGLASADGALYWSGALAAVTASTALLAVPLPTRVLPVAAAVLGQLSPPLLVSSLVVDAGHPVALAATVLAGQAVVGLTTAALWPAGSRTADARAVVAAGSVLALLAAAVTAAAAAYGEDGSLVVGTALLLVLAVVTAVAGTVLAAGTDAPEDGRVAACDTASALLVVGASWAPVTVLTRAGWVGPVLAVPVLVLLAVLPLVPRTRRAVPGRVLVAAGLVPLLSAVEVLTAAAERMLRTPEDAWALTSSAAGVTAGWPSDLALVGTAAVLLLGAEVLRRRVLREAALPVVATAAALVAPAAGAGYPVQLAGLLAVAAGLLVAGARLDVHGFVRAGWLALGCGAVAVLLAVPWSFATAGATLAGIPAAAVALLAGALAARDAEALRGWRVLLVVAALVLGLTEAGALARHDGAGWPAVWSLVAVLAAATATAVASLVSLRTAGTDPFWAPLHRAAVAVATSAAVVAAWQLADWRDVRPGGQALTAVCAAAALAVAASAPWTTRRPVRGTVQVVAAVTGAPALLASAVDPDRLWVALLVAGLAVAVVALTSARPALGWLSAVLLAASSWVRLVLSDVDAPEAYTAPGGVALLVLGYLRRRRDPELGSWQAYGSGLTLVLVPSLLRAVTDSGDLRPLLLAAVAAGVVAVGAVRRLQAPLLLGAAVLAVDALVQLAPYLVAAYQVVPRWVTIGSIGLALLVAGATYERRVRDLRRVGRQVARLG